jgi:hypothetical protein
MGISTYLQSALLTHVFRNTNYSRPATIYVSLHTADPGDNGSGAEVAGTGYQREGIDTGASSGWTAPASGDSGYKTDNAADVTFPAAGASWGTVTHAALWDSLTTGNMLFYGQLGTSKTVSTGDVLVISAGDLDAVLKSS